MNPTIWRDDDNLYLEHPTYVLKFPFTEGGLAKALKLVPYFPSLRAAPKGTTNLPKAKSLKGHIARNAPKVAKATLRSREIKGIYEEHRSSLAALIRKRDSQ
jgi:hypothetical protein